MSGDIPTQELADALRAAMRRHAQGVTVLSGVDEQGERVAMTASAVTTVSMEPPSLLVSVGRESSMYPVLKAGCAFCVNLLSRDMSEIADRCAFVESAEERFAVGNWTLSTEHAIPYLANAQASLFCQPDGYLEYGSHLICVGRLMGAQLSEREANPLVYVDGGYKGVS